MIENLYARKSEVIRDSIGISNSLKSLTTLRRNIKAVGMSKFVDQDTSTALAKIFNSTTAAHADLKQKARKHSLLAHAYLRVIEDINNLK